MKNKKFLVSYFPLLIPNPDLLGKDLDLKGKSEDDLRELFGSFGEHIRVHGVLWANYPFEKDNCTKSIIPVMIIDKMVEVVDHLLIWSEGDLRGWFTLCFKSKTPNDYVVSLMPNIMRSIERQESASGSNPDDFDYTILFDSLCTVCHGNTLSLVKNRLFDESMVGFVDTNSIDRDDPMSLDPDSILVVGPFNIEFDPDGFTGSYLDSIFEEYEKSGESPKIKPRSFIDN